MIKDCLQRGMFKSKNYILTKKLGRGLITTRSERYSNCCLWISQDPKLAGVGWGAWLSLNWRSVPFKDCCHQYICIKRRPAPCLAYLCLIKPTLVHCTGCILNTQWVERKRLCLQHFFTLFNFVWLIQDIISYGVDITHSRHGWCTFLCPHCRF